MGSIGISDGDVHQMLSIARRYGDDDGEILPWELMHDLRRLVPCDSLDASGQDTPQWEFFANQELPRRELTPAQEAAFEVAYRTHYWQSVCSYADRSGDLTSVTRTSDHLTEGEWRNTGMYVDYLQPAGVEHEIIVYLDAGRPQRTLRLLFSRGPGSDFSERDVAILTLLRPHLQSAFIAAERRRRGLLPLTKRQRQILQYVAAGYSNRQIARQLDLSETTVRTHLENIFARLEVNSRTAAVACLNGQPMLAAVG